MSKKTKSVKKKTAVSSQYKRHHRHHWHPEEFLLVVAGGLIVIVLIYVLSGSFGMTGSNGGTNGVSAQEMTVDNQTEETVSISEFTFSPDPVTVKKGTTVTWTNNDSESHSATADDGSFDTGMLENGESGSVTFSEVGGFSYHSANYPNMTGNVVVVE